MNDIRMNFFSNTLLVIAVKVTFNFQLSLRKCPKKNLANETASQCVKMEVCSWKTSQLLNLNFVMSYGV